MDFDTLRVVAALAAITLLCFYTAPPSPPTGRSPAI